MEPEHAGKTSLQTRNCWRENMFFLAEKNPFSKKQHQLVGGFNPFEKY